MMSETSLPSEEVTDMAVDEELVEQQASDFQTAIWLC